MELLSEPTLKEGEKLETYAVSCERRSEGAAEKGVCAAYTSVPQQTAARSALAIGGNLIVEEADAGLPKSTLGSRQLATKTERKGGTQKQTPEPLF